MPLPSILLGYVGERGNTEGEVLDCLHRGIAADGTTPPGTVYLVTGQDIRARTRSWQFASARRELEDMGIDAEIVDSPPTDSPSILGIQLGAPRVYPARYGRYVPGAMADHLTSSAAVFGSAGQTKLTEWIKAGAVASAGTVTEPYIFGQGTAGHVTRVHPSSSYKFPNARVYVHYVSGCTALESLFQSIRCPLQILLVGEPLACPWQSGAVLTLSGLGRRTMEGKRAVTADIRADGSMSFTRYVFLVDGRVVSDGPEGTFMLDTDELAAGGHTLRAVAYSTGPVREQVFADAVFSVRRSSSGRERMEFPISNKKRPMSK